MYTCLIMTHPHPDISGLLVQVMSSVPTVRNKRGEAAAFSFYASLSGTNSQKTGALELSADTGMLQLSLLLNQSYIPYYVLFLKGACLLAHPMPSCLCEYKCDDLIS